MCSYCGDAERRPTYCVSALNSIVDNTTTVQTRLLLEACEAQHDAIDILFARLIEADKTFFPSKSGMPWNAALQGRAAIALATRGEPHANP